MPYLMVPQNEWLIREAQAADLSFIYSTWLRSYQCDSAVGKSCRKTVFFLEYPAIIDEILDKARILVAYFLESPSVVLSYLVYEPKILHYVFTKEVYQKNGIAKSLFTKAFGADDLHRVCFTHRTSTAEPILQKYGDTLNFNPFKLYQRMESGE